MTKKQTTIMIDGKLRSRVKDTIKNSETFKARYPGINNLSSAIELSLTNLLNELADGNNPIEA